MPGLSADKQRPLPDPIGCGCLRRVILDVRERLEARVSAWAVSHDARQARHIGMSYSCAAHRRVQELGGTRRLTATVSSESCGAADTCGQHRKTTCTLTARFLPSAGSRDQVETGDVYRSSRRKCCPGPRHHVCQKHSEQPWKSRIGAPGSPVILFWVSES
jgi:hypothetical protein